MKMIKIKINFISKDNECNITNCKELEKLLKDKNNYFIFNEKIKIGELYNKFKFSKEFCRKIDLVICSECPGISNKKENKYKIINRIEEFKLHCINKYNKYIPVNSICRFDISNNYIIV